MSIKPVFVILNSAKLVSGWIKNTLELAWLERTANSTRAKWFSAFENGFPVDFRTGPENSSNLGDNPTYIIPVYARFTVARDGVLSRLGNWSLLATGFTDPHGRDTV